MPHVDAAFVKSPFPIGHILRKNLGDPIGGSVIAYELDGVAYIAVAGGMKNTVTQQTGSGSAWVAILALSK